MIQNMAPEDEPEHEPTQEEWEEYEKRKKDLQ